MSITPDSAVSIRTAQCLELGGREWGSKRRWVSRFRVSSCIGIGTWPSCIVWMPGGKVMAKDDRSREGRMGGRGKQNVLSGDVEV
jgi:hypothetical protein